MKNKMTNKEKLIAFISDMDEVSDEFYKIVKNGIVDYHVKIQTKSSQLGALYESINLNSDIEYDKHLRRQQEIKDKVLASISVPEAIGNKRQTVKIENGHPKLFELDSEEDV